MEGKKVKGSRLKGRVLILLAIIAIIILLVQPVESGVVSRLFKKVINAITQFISYLLAFLFLSLIYIANAWLMKALFCSLTFNPVFYGSGRVSSFARDCGTTGAGAAGPQIRNIIMVFSRILYPMFAVAFAITAVYMIFMAPSPSHRARAKSIMTKLLAGMVLSALAIPIYQVLIDVSSATTDGVLSVINTDILPPGDDMFDKILVKLDNFAPVPTNMFGADGTITDEMVKTMELGRVSSGVLMLIVNVFFIGLAIATSKFRYVMVSFIGIFFPLTIALYMFEFTRNVGRRMLKTTLVFVFTPMLMAIWFGAAMALLDYASSTDHYFVGLVLMVVMSAMMTIVPLQMSGALEIFGSILSSVGQYIPGAVGVVMVAAGGVMQGKGASSVAMAGMKYSAGKLVGKLKSRFSEKVFGGRGAGASATGEGRGGRGGGGSGKPSESSTGKPGERGGGKPSERGGGKPSEASQQHARNTGTKPSEGSGGSGGSTGKPSDKPSDKPKGAGRVLAGAVGKAAAGKMIEGASGGAVKSDNLMKGKAGSGGSIFSDLKQAAKTAKAQGRSRIAGVGLRMALGQKGFNEYMSGKRGLGASFGRRGAQLALRMSDKDVSAAEKRAQGRRINKGLEEKRGRINDALKTGKVDGLSDGDKRTLAKSLGINTADNKNPEWRAQIGKAVEAKGVKDATEAVNQRIDKAKEKVDEHYGIKAKKQKDEEKKPQETPQDMAKAGERQAEAQRGQAQFDTSGKKYAGVSVAGAEGRSGAQREGQPAGKFRQGVRNLGRRLLGKTVEGATMGLIRMPDSALAGGGARSGGRAGGFRDSWRAAKQRGMKGVTGVALRGALGQRGFERYLGERDKAGGLAGRMRAFGRALGRRGMQIAARRSDRQVDAAIKRGTKRGSLNQLNRERRQTSRAVRRGDLTGLDTRTRRIAAINLRIDTSNSNWGAQLDSHMRGMSRNQRRELGGKMNASFDRRESTIKNANGFGRMPDAGKANQKLRESMGGKNIPGLNATAVAALNGEGINTVGELGSMSDAQRDRIAESGAGLNTRDLDRMRTAAQHNSTRDATRKEQRQMDEGKAPKGARGGEDDRTRELKENIQGVRGGRKPQREDFLTGVEEERE